jgi:hypothetical protein
MQADIPMVKRTISNWGSVPSTFFTRFMGFIFFVLSIAPFSGIAIFASRCWSGYCRLRFFLLKFAKVGGKVLH